MKMCRCNESEIRLLCASAGSSALVYTSIVTVIIPACDLGEELQARAEIVEFRALLR